MSDTPRTVNAIIERIRKEVAHSEAASREGCIGCTHVMLRNEDAMALVGVISKGSKAEKRLDELAPILDDVLEYLERRHDTKEGPDGPEPNAEMVLSTNLRMALGELP